MRVTGMLFALSTMVSSPAWACGGFFCFTAPIDQSAERIVFGIDAPSGTVEAHVQIFYSGPSERFSWVVPVPDVPDVQLGTDALFTQLDWRTTPRFVRTDRDLGTCDRPVVHDTGVFYEADSAAFDSDTDAGGGVQVYASGNTGPFDWVVVGATSIAPLTAWLEDPDGDPATPDGYTLPAGFADKARGYLAADAKFVAFKLAKDATAGEIAPIRLTYRGTEASIPLVLTSIAATPDLRLEVYVLNNQRAVPANYLHVEPSPVAYNWLRPGIDSYRALVTRAADEAGGQAFATDYYGSITAARGSVWASWMYNTWGLEAYTTPWTFVDEMMDRGFPRNTVVQALLRKHIPKPASLAHVSDASFYNCLWCYRTQLAGQPFDPVAFVADLEEYILEPAQDAEALLAKHTHVTRLTSSISPAEMTVDPLFVLNPTLTAPVRIDESATLYTDCTVETDPDLAPRRLVLDDGTVIAVPSVSWFDARATRYDTWNWRLRAPAAGRILQLGPTGSGVLLVDADAATDAAVAKHNAAWSGGGSGIMSGTGVVNPGVTLVPRAPGACAQAAGGASWLGLAALGLAVRRRRQVGGSPPSA